MRLSPNLVVPTSNGVQAQGRSNALSAREGHPASAEPAILGEFDERGGLRRAALQQRLPIRAQGVVQPRHLGALAPPDAPVDADDLVQLAVLGSQLFHFVARGLTDRIASQLLLAGFEEVLAPAVVQIRRDAFSAA